MSSNNVVLSSLLLKDNFGDIVSSVGLYLAKKGCTALRILSNETNFTLDQVRKALCVLIQHNLATFQQHSRGFVTYQLDTEQVLLLLNYARYIYCAKTLYGDAAELIVEELLQHGQVSMARVCSRVEDRLNEALREGKKVGPSLVREKFTSLVQTHFIQRCPELQQTETEERSRLPVLVPNEKLKYHLPLETETGKKRKRETEESEQPAKKSKTENVDNAAVLWCVSCERFHQYFRDVAIVSAVSNLIDQKAGEVMRTMLRLSEVKSDPTSPTSYPMSSNEIFQAVPSELQKNKSEIDQYLSLLVELSEEFVSRIGDSGGGIYCINFKKAAASLAKAAITSVVQERFGSKSARIFRLLLMKRYLEQKQIEEFAMIPAKEAKDMTYVLFAENFLSLQEIPRTPDHAPSRTFYLYTVNLVQVSRMLLDQCYRTMCNILTRRDHELKENKRLLDKQQRVEAITASLLTGGAEDAQVQEIEEMITPPERAQLTKVKHISTKLEQAELQVAETIFTLKLFLSYTQSGR